MYCFRHLRYFLSNRSRRKSSNNVVVPRPVSCNPPLLHHALHPPYAVNRAPTSTHRPRTRFQHPTTPSQMLAVAKVQMVSNNNTPTRILPTPPPSHRLHTHASLHPSSHPPTPPQHPHPTPSFPVLHPPPPPAPRPPNPSHSPHTPTPAASNRSSTLPPSLAVSGPCACQSCRLSQSRLAGGVLARAWAWEEGWVWGWWAPV